MDVTGNLINFAQTANRKGNIASYKFIYESAADNLTATAGGGQANAFQLSTELSRITTVATAGDSVQMPPAIPGLTLMVANHGANAMQVFGNGTDTINDSASATGVSQMVNSVVIYVCTGIGRWYANGLGTGFAGSFETQSYTDGLTAHAGGGQNLAPIISTMISRFTTVGSAGDSTTLPVVVPGMNITVINATATSMNVFPDTGSTIDGGSVNAAFALAAGKTATFFNTVAGAWHTIH